MPLPTTAQVTLAAGAVHETWGPAKVHYEPPGHKKSDGAPKPNTNGLGALEHGHLANQYREHVQNMRAHPAHRDASHPLHDEVNNAYRRALHVHRFHAAMVAQHGQTYVGAE